MSAGEDGEDEIQREPNLMVGEANMGETGKLGRHPVLTTGELTGGGGGGGGGGGRDPAMLSPPSLRAYADRMQADYLRYRLPQHDSVIRFR